MHWLWQSAEQINLVGRQWEELGVAWIEDALPIESLSEFRKLKDLTSIPLAYGDEQNGRAICMQLIYQEQIDVLRLDATVVGGLTEFIRLVAPQTLQVCVFPGIFSRNITQLAAAPSTT